MDWRYTCQIKQYVWLCTDISSVTDDRQLMIKRNCVLTFNWSVSIRPRPKLLNPNIEMFFLKAWRYQKESQKERQYNDYRERDKKTNNDQLNTRDWATWAPQYTGDKLMCSGSGTLYVMLNNTNIITRNPWISSLLVSQQSLSKKSW